MKPPRDGSALENIKQTLDSYLGRLTLTLLFGWGCVCHREEDEKRGDDGWELIIASLRVAYWIASGE
jgi:hypothetical protein